MTLYFLIPFLGSNLGFLYRNWCPAECFGGDTLVYFGGMVFAVVVSALLIKGNSGKFVKDGAALHDPASLQFLT